MKILITTDWYKPVINGVVTSVTNLEEGLRGAGHDVRILTLSNDLHSYRKENVTFIGSIGVGVIYPNARLRARLNDPLVQELSFTANASSPPSPLPSASLMRAAVR